EEVLGVEDHLVDVLAEIGDRVVDHLEVRLEGDAEIVPHVEVPRLPDDRHDGRLRAEAFGEVPILGRLHPCPPRRAEGRDLGVLQPEPLDGAEELLVARVRARPAALDVAEPEVVELLGDAELVVEREGDVLGLRTIAQRRVVQLEPLHEAPPTNASCSVRTASSVYFSSITTEILISDVEIIWMLMPSAESTSNLRAAMPACVRIPTPTIDTFATSVCPVTPCAAMSRAVASTSAFACA